MNEGPPTLTSGVVEEVLPNGLFRVMLEGEVRICHMGSMLRRFGVTTIREQERVTVRTEGDGVFRGEITHVRPQLVERAARVPAVRASLISPRGAVVLKPEDQRIDRSSHPDWPTGAEGTPQAGDGVYCTAGFATIVRVLGRVGNGSRLLELRLPGEPRSSFFAAASNVLMEPRVGADEARTEEFVEGYGAAR